MKPPASAIESLLEGIHADPFSLLGVHEGPEGAFARAVLAGAETAEAYDLSGKKLGILPEQGKDGVETMFDDVYAEVPWHIAEQREQALSEGRD